MDTAISEHPVAEREPLAAALSYLDLPVVPANRVALADHGVFVDTSIPVSALPLARGAVQEGHHLPFVCQGNPVVRTARIHPRPFEVKWLERHLRTTQLFVGLGDAPMLMVLGKPNHHLGRSLPDLDQVRVFLFPPGHGVLIHAGTWHDFPLALLRPVTVLTIDSEEVAGTLAAQACPGEMDRGDVCRIDLTRRTGRTLRIRR